MLAQVFALMATLLFISSVQAEGVDQKASKNKIASEALEQTFISGESIEKIPRATWEVADSAGSRIVSASGKEAVQQASESATRYSSKSYIFPTGTIMVLEFEKAQGGMLHAITEESALYVLEGEGSVDVAGERVPIKQGDVVSYPSGALRGKADAVIVAWRVTGTTSKDESRPMVIKSSDATLRQLGYWPGPDGQRVVVTTAEDLRNAPPNAIRLEMKSYSFDGNSVTVTKNYRGGPTNKSTGERDGLLYITSGKMRFFQDDIDVIAGPGDAIRETAGRYHNWIRLEDSSFVGIGTSPATPIKVDKPTDY